MKRYIIRMWSDKVDPVIVEVDIVRENEDVIYLAGRTVSKETSYIKVRNTWEEAQAELIRLQSAICENHRRQLRRSERLLKKIMEQEKL
jgi:hypothetical protein